MDDKVFCTIKRPTGFKSYLLDNCNDNFLEVLGHFLTNDVDSIAFWKEWINNSKYEDTAGNFTFLEKEGDKIIIGYLYAEDEYKNIFETTQKQLLEILDHWEELCKQRPHEIIITKEGDKVTLEGRD